MTRFGANFLTCIIIVPTKYIECSQIEPLYAVYNIIPFSFSSLNAEKAQYEIHQKQRKPMILVQELYDIVGYLS